MSRDTDADWNSIGDSEPWHGVLSSEKFLKANIDAERLDEFYRSGVKDVERVIAVLDRHFSPLNLGTALDFGCGVGRQSLAMASRCTKVYGVDVSQGMLRHATERCHGKEVKNVEFLTELPQGVKFDWINSCIVFQHIPPTRGYEIMESLFSQLSDRGLISIQVTYHRDSRHIAGALRDVAAYVYDGMSMRLLDFKKPDVVGSMSMYDYDLNNLFRIMHKQGLKECFIEQTDHAGYHGVYLFGRRR